MDEDINEANFFFKLFFKPAKFFKEYYKKSEGLPLFYFVSFIFALWNWFANTIKKMESVSWISGSSSWLLFILFSLILGVIRWVMKYYIWWWLYNLRMKLAWWSYDTDKSRQLNLYSNFIPSIFIVVIYFIRIYIYDSPDDYINNTKDYNLIFTILLILSVYYSVYVSYMWVNAITDVKRSKSRFWFLIFPILFYTWGFLFVLGIIKFS